MEEVVRLPLTDTVRIQQRDAKLNAREKVLADRARSRKRVCPCNVCLSENYSERSREVVEKHLRIYGRASFCRGSTQGFPSDESDTEWDLSIREEWGTRANAFNRDPTDRLDCGLGMVGLVEHTFQIYDGWGGGLGHGDGEDNVNVHQEGNVNAEEEGQQSQENIAPEEDFVDGDPDLPATGPTARTLQFDHLRENSPTPLYAGDNFDVCLQPLLEELLELWTVGRVTHDAANYKGQSTFTMKAILL